MPFPFETDLLLVDDSQADAMLMKIALQRIAPELKLTWIDNGFKALEFLLDTYERGGKSGIFLPKIMLLDLKMPSMSGTDVLMEISHTPFLKEIPIITYSSFAIPDEEYTILRSGTEAHLFKPFRFDMLEALLNKIIKRWMLVS